MDLSKALDLMADTAAGEDDQHDALHALRVGISEIEQLREFAHSVLYCLDTYGSVDETVIDIEKTRRQLAGQPRGECST